MSSPIVSTISLDSVTWSPIKPPIDCYSIEIFNPIDDGTYLKLRSDPSDADSEIVLLSLSTRLFEIGKNSSPYRSNYPIIYGQLSAGSADIKVIAR
jgi:hypothetical protein